jgi:hypothetical protein
MRIVLIFLIFIVIIENVNGQNYNKEKKCGTDTIDVNYRDLKYGNEIKYKAFKCSQVSKLGIRFDLGYNRLNYNISTKSWLGNYIGGVFGIGIVYDKLTFGAEFRSATVVSPKKELDINSILLESKADLALYKIEYKIGYSINTRYNIAIEPFLAYTRSSFEVLNENELNKMYNFSKIHSPTFGFTLNKYFVIKDFKFLSVFFKYCYSLTNYQRLNNSLGKGYTDISFGLSYKAFIKRIFFERIN